VRPEAFGADAGRQVAQQPGSTTFTLEDGAKGAALVRVLSSSDCETLAPHPMRLVQQSMVCRAVSDGLSLPSLRTVPALSSLSYRRTGLTYRCFPCTGSGCSPLSCLLLASGLHFRRAGSQVAMASSTFSSLAKWSAAFWCGQFLWSPV
jgi:hypothetical protein